MYLKVLLNWDQILYVKYLVVYKNGLLPFN